MLYLPGMESWSEKNFKSVIFRVLPFFYFVVQFNTDHILLRILIVSSGVMSFTQQNTMWHDDA